jgi:hypothetical protein
VKALAHFDAVWERCAQLSILHAYLAKNVSGVLQPDELLRAEWVARVSALDLYVHELVAQLMLSIFEGRRPVCPGYARFQISNETLGRIRAAGSPADASAAFDLHVRDQLSRMTFQAPDDIADAVRLCSPVELWNDVAVHLGATPATKATQAKALKTDLSLIVRRRNIIAHEGDLQQASTRIPLAVTPADLVDVRNCIESVVSAVDAVV